jgi:hypothetical protein
LEYPPPDIDECDVDRLLGADGLAAGMGAGAGAGAGAAAGAGALWAAVFTGVLPDELCSAPNSPAAPAATTPAAAKATTRGRAYQGCGAG